MYTVRGKILEGEIFGKSLLQGKIGESTGILQLFHCIFIYIGGENFGELNTIHQIHQIFPTPKFSHVR